MCVCVCVCACVCAKMLQSCLTLCDPMDYSPPGSSIQGILQARILEWVAMPSSRGIFPTQGSNPCLFSLMSSSLAGGFFTMSATYIYIYIWYGIHMYGICMYVCIHVNLSLANLATSFYGVLHSPPGLWVGIVIAMCLVFPEVNSVFACYLQCH